MCKYYRGARKFNPPVMKLHALFAPDHPIPAVRSATITTTPSRRTATSGKRKAANPTTISVKISAGTVRDDAGHDQRCQHGCRNGIQRGGCPARDSLESRQDKMAADACRIGRNRSGNNDPRDIGQLRHRSDTFHFSFNRFRLRIAARNQGRQQNPGNAADADMPGRADGEKGDC